MNMYLLSFFVGLINVGVSHGQEKITSNQCNQSKTEIYIVGTYHSGNKHMTGDSLYKLVKNISPNLLLTESLSYREKTPLKYKIGHFLGFAHYSIEYLTEKRIIESDTVIKILPFDIDLKNRLNYVEQINRNYKEAWKNINKFINSSEISEQQKNTFKRYINIDNFLSIYYTTKDLYCINRKNVSDSVEKRMSILYDEIIPILKNEKSLIKWADYLISEKEFWELRNTKMTENIISLLTSHESVEKVVIVCGLFHKYFLQNLLSPLASINNFELKYF